MDVTGLLKAANEGDRKALDELAPLVYEELRWLAHRQLQQEYGERTLSTTGLVHEAYLKLVNAPNLPATNRRHFYAAAAQAMRHILISEARRRNAAKRGDGVRPVELDSIQLAIDEISDELLALDEALDRLEVQDKRLSDVVHYRFFAGLTIDETANLIEVSARTVKRDWRLAKAWLYREMSGAVAEANSA